MLQLFKDIKEACQQRRVSHARGEPVQVEDATSSLAALLRRVRAAPGFSHAATKAVVSPVKLATQHNEISIERPIPFLYPTPDGALRPASVRHRRLQAAAPRFFLSQTDAHTTSSVTNDSQWSRLDKQTSPDANRATMGRGRDASMPCYSHCDENKVTQRHHYQQQQQKPIAVALDCELIEVLMSVCASINLSGECEKNIFTFAERVEMLHTLVYLTCASSSDWGVELETLLEGSGSGSLSPICRSNLLHLPTTACEVLKQILELLMEREREDCTTGDSRHLLRCFVTVANAVIIMLGCRVSHHWENDLSDKEGNDASMHIDTGTTAPFSCQQMVEQDRSCCLCCTTTTPLCDSMVAALSDKGLWQHLWRVIVFPLLTELRDQQEKQQQEKQKKQRQDYEGEPVVLDEVNGSSTHCSTERILGVRVTLKMMTLLLLRSPAMGEQILSNLMCPPTPEEEEKLELMLQASIPVAESKSGRRQLTMMEKSLMYTLRQMSGLLLFRRVSCHVANAMHVILTYLLVLPTTSEVDLQLLFVSLFFAAELSPSPRPNATPLSSVALPVVCKNENGADVGGPGFLPTMSLVLGRILHVLSFRLAVNYSNPVHPSPKQPAEHTATTICPELVVPAAMLTVVLLLGQMEKKQRERLDLMIAHHAVYKTCENSPWLQEALTAGLSRTHQIILLLYSLTTHKAVATPPSTLILESSCVMAFSQLVRPNPPVPSALLRKQVKSTMWAETLSIVMRKTASIAASASTGQRKKSQTSFSCTLTCPAQPAALKRRDNAAEKWEQSAGHHNLLQVYVRTPHQEDATGLVAGGGGISGSCATKTGPQPLPEELLPPMVFSYETVTFTGNSHGGGMTRLATSPTKKIFSSVETIFVDREGTDYARITHNPRCLSSLQRNLMEYTAAVDMTIVAAPRECEVREGKKLLPLNMVIVACSTLHGDELQLWLQPPERPVALTGEGRVNSSREPRKNELYSKQDRQRKDVVPQRRDTLGLQSSKVGAVLLCSLSRHRAGDAATRVAARSTSSQFAKEPQSLSNNGKNYPHGECEAEATKDSGVLEQRGQSSGSSSSSMVDSEWLADVDAYVSNLKPAPLIDVALERKDQEIVLIQRQLQRAQMRGSSLQYRLQEAVTQRENLTQCLANRCAEIQLCHKDIITPLRREITRLRHSLALRNEEVSMAISLCRKLRTENETMAASIRGIRCDVENMVQTIVQPD